VLIDHFQELEPTAFGACIDMEVRGPYLVEMLSPVTPHRGVNRSCPLVTWTPDRCQGFTAAPIGEAHRLRG